MNFNESVRLIKRAEEKSRRETERAAEGLKQLQEALKKGEISSGDRLTDFLFVWYGLSGDKVARNFRTLRQELTDEAGKPVLVFLKETYEEEMEQHLSGEGIMPTPKDYRIDLTLKLGILSNRIGLDLDVSSGRVNIVTGKYVRATKDAMIFGSEDILLNNLEWRAINNNIPNELPELIHLHRELWESYPYAFSMPTKDSGILVGDEVRKYFDRLDGESSYVEALKMLNG